MPEDLTLTTALLVESLARRAKTHGAYYEEVNLSDLGDLSVLVLCLVEDLKVLRERIERLEALPCPSAPPSSSTT